MTRVACDECGSLKVAIEQRDPGPEVITMTEAKRRSESPHPSWPARYQYRCTGCGFTVPVNTVLPPMPTEVTK